MPGGRPVRNSRIGHLPPPAVSDFRPTAVLVHRATATGSPIGPMPYPPCYTLRCKTGTVGPLRSGAINSSRRPARHGWANRYDRQAQRLFHRPADHLPRRIFPGRREGCPASRRAATRRWATNPRKHQYVEAGRPRQINAGVCRKPWAPVRAFGFSGGASARRQRVANKPGKL